MERSFKVSIHLYQNLIQYSLVCGNGQIHKGSPTTPLSQIAVANLIEEVLIQNNIDTALCSSLVGLADIGIMMKLYPEYL